MFLELPLGQAQVGVVTSFRCAGHYHTYLLLVFSPGGIIFPSSQLPLSLAQTFVAILVI